MEYRFPNHFVSSKNPSCVPFGLEICSKTLGYRSVWPSDITFPISDRELLTCTSPGDFGGRRGKLTPIWWTDGNTQFSLLKTISVDGNGAYLDGMMKSKKISTDTLAPSAQSYVSFKIEIKKDAKRTGGVNIFEKSYGDHPQNIVMHVGYQPVGAG